LRRSELGASEGLYWKYEAFIKEKETLLGSCSGAAGEIFSIRKNLYNRPPANTINDDFFMAMDILRQGYRLVYVPDAHSTERVSASAKDEVARRARIIAGRYQAILRAPQYLSLRRPLQLWKIVSHKFLRPLVPFFMIGILVLNILAVLIPVTESQNPWLDLGTPVNTLLLSGQAVFYLAAWVGSRLPGGNRLRKIFYLPTFLVNSNYAALLGLARFMRGQQSSAWQRVTRRES
jgi:cellulose synthase/poly-beta-1,6-N-acetylglucosamine synthase-like glycosyltransferase